jgi:hypothetical protein
VRETGKDKATLAALNRNYVRSVDEADTAWFDANLASEFMNTNPNGSLIDRAAFLAQIGRRSSFKAIHEQDVNIRLFGDFAIIHARTAYLKPEGTPGAGRYTDDWLSRDGRWQCVSAHVSGPAATSCTRPRRRGRSATCSPLAIPTSPDTLLRLRRRHTISPWRTPTDAAGSRDRRLGLPASWG